MTQSEAIEQAKAEERAAIVAWLQREIEWNKKYAADEIYQLKYRADALSLPAI